MVRVTGLKRGELAWLMILSIPVADVTSGILVPAYASLEWLLGIIINIICINSLFLFAGRLSVASRIGIKPQRALALIWSALCVAGSIGI